MKSSVFGPGYKRFSAIAIAAILIAIFCISLFYSRTGDSLVLTDEQLSERTTLRFETRRSRPHYLVVQVEGDIDGIAYLETHESMRTRIGPGNVKKTIQNEYYEGSAEATYIPEDVTGGRLTVTWKFRH